MPRGRPRLRRTIRKTKTTGFTSQNPNLHRRWHKPKSRKLQHQAARTSRNLTIRKFTAAFWEEAQRILDAQNRKIQKYTPLHQLQVQDVRKELEKLGPQPEDLTSKAETPPTTANPLNQKFLPPLSERALRLLKESGECGLQPEDLTPTVETPPTTEDQGSAKTTPAGQKQNNQKRPSWRSGTYRPPIKEGQSNIKPAIKGPTALNQA